MNLVKLSDLFNIYSGSKMDLNKQEIIIENGINFVSRTSKNSGIVCRVAENKNGVLYKKGAITVTLGGTYLLSAFVQQEDFYTSQNVKVLIPKMEMTDDLKLFYCTVIRSNRFRYASHGREANKTLAFIKVPAINEAKLLMPNIKINMPGSKSLQRKKMSLSDRKWDWFLLNNYFDVNTGSYYPVDSFKTGNIPLITASMDSNGISKWTNLTPAFNERGITIGKVSCGTFYQSHPFCVSSDVTALTNKKILNPFVGIFLVTIINMEKFKWSYGRQIRLNNVKRLKIKLPVISKGGEPDWKFMENYIKSLPYSCNLK
ncbi:restriction endonuclease subunit S [Arsenophonus nasoniae]|uniref:Restriction endonuclease subunit S n=1 Tax=Arsenophonus nasoniae TaxID=638 RepID=A0AA95GCI6_9GAMM|nr:restriction endonuclease subunit S [Arsenophonus nasoniae]WGL96531.1 restriction endonuclease subunit S [Arsenophonus nasoniae]